MSSAFGKMVSQASNNISGAGPGNNKDDMRGLTQYIADLRACRVRELEEKRINKEMAHIRQKFKGESGKSPIRSSNMAIERCRDATSLTNVSALCGLDNVNCSRCRGEP